MTPRLRFLYLFAALVGVLLALPSLRRQEREAAKVWGEVASEVATYVADRDRAAERRERVMLAVTAVSCVVAVIAAVAALVAVW